MCTTYSLTMGDFRTMAGEMMASRSILTTKVEHQFVHVMKNIGGHVSTIQTKVMPKGDYRVVYDGRHCLVNDSETIKIYHANRGEVIEMIAAEVTALRSEVARLNKKIEDDGVIIQKAKDQLDDLALYKSFHDHMNAYFDVGSEMNGWIPQEIADVISTNLR